VGDDQAGRVIPSNLLQRMDVVTGGASATYGSGAMAGVVNLVLNNRLQGINLDMRRPSNDGCYPFSRPGPTRPVVSTTSNLA
jgi:outer membrane receptor protein involved in Fe transport